MACVENVCHFVTNRFTQEWFLALASLSQHFHQPVYITRYFSVVMLYVLTSFRSDQSALWGFVLASALDCGVVLVIHRCGVLGLNHRGLRSPLLSPGLHG